LNYSKIRNDASNPSTADNRHIIIHAIEPRLNYNKKSLKKTDLPISSCYVELETKHLIEESGYYELPYAVGRFYQATNEKYGRSPAMEVASTLSMLNRMEQTRIQSAERVSNPPWLAPNDGSVRRISNTQGSIIYYNAANPASKPEQMIVRDNTIVNDSMIQLKTAEVEDAFFLPLFNPLVNRVNMTATESQLRATIALQNLIPAISRITNELLTPLFVRIYSILARSGVYPQPPDVLLNSNGKVIVAFNSKATLALKQLELQGVYQTLESMAFLAQVNPEVMDNFDLDKVARLTSVANSVPTTIIRPEREVKKQREARAAAKFEAEQNQQAIMAADVYNRTSKAPEAGSAANALLAEVGL
jgi:hypothetical protein